MMRVQRPWAVAWAVAFAAACAVRSPGVDGAAADAHGTGDPCRRGHRPVAGDRAATLGIPYPVDFSRAPIPRNPGEELVFGHLYSALVELDCRGVPYPAVARSWRMEQGGRRWVFFLDSTAAFWDGSPVRASHVIDALARDVPDPGIRPAVPALQVTAVDAMTVAVELPVPVVDVRLFADPVFAVIRPDHVGTGRYRSGVQSTEGTVLRARSASLPHLLLGMGSGARDLLDEGAEVLVTADASVVQYARSRRDFAVYPLRWATTYVLFAHDGFPALPNTAEWLEGLARDAVRASARAATTNAWWESIRECAVDREADRSGPVPVHEVISYPDHDPVARDLAQRIAAVTRRPSRAVSWEEAEASIRRGAAAVVFPLPIEFSSPCLLSAEWRQVLRRYRIDPLVEVRPQLVTSLVGPGAFDAYWGGIEFRAPRRGTRR